MTAAAAVAGGGCQRLSLLWAWGRKDLGLLCSMLVGTAMLGWKSCGVGRKAAPPLFLLTQQRAPDSPNRMREDGEGSF